MYIQMYIHRKNNAPAQILAILMPNIYTNSELAPRAISHRSRRGGQAPFRLPQWIFLKNKLYVSSAANRPPHTFTCLPIADPRPVPKKQFTPYQAQTITRKKKGKHTTRPLVPPRAPCSVHSATSGYVCAANLRPCVLTCSSCRAKKN